MSFMAFRQFQIQIRLQCMFYQAAEKDLTTVLPSTGFTGIPDDGPLIQAWGAIQAMLTAAANISKALGANLTKTLRSPENRYVNLSM
jgi:hypothetical protein